VTNAGAKWEDSPVVVDQGLITSRHPGDLDAFSAKIIEEIARRPPYPAQRCRVA
jgi:protease I